MTCTSQKGIVDRPNGITPASELATSYSSRLAAVIQLFTR